MDVLSECEEVVTVCATRMLVEKDANALRASIGQDQNCGDVTAPTLRVLTHGSSHDREPLTAQVQTCLIACCRSDDLCEQHERCRLCADATGRAADT
ncbi:hypothetical protein [Streptomyces sp. NPDC050988]|uniref:hypothetical protein n=1 Tax=Streptomyces sp. NPDC050988 TaxID=3365637 RepID=UPI0037AE42C9